MASLGPSVIAALIFLITFSLALPAPDPSIVAQTHLNNGPAVEAEMYVDLTPSRSHRYGGLAIKLP